MIEDRPDPMVRSETEEKVDPVFRATFESLPPRVRQGIEAGNPRAVKRLYGLYDLVRTGAPNRADRRRKR